MRRSLAPLIACVAALLAPAGVSAAVQCGDVVVNDVKLRSDLDCSVAASNGLTVGADGVEIDLNGERLIGPPTDYNGIEADAGIDNLSVKDGTIKGFNDSVDLETNKNVTLSRLNMKLGGDNQGYGVYAGEQRHLHMNHVDVDNAVYAYYVYDSKDVKLRHSKVTGSDPADTYGVYLGSSSENTTGAVDDVQVNGAYRGFFIYGKSSGLKVTDSTANNNGNAGFYFNNDADPREYTANNNTANDNGEHGLWAARRVAGSGNRAKDNGTENCVKVNCG